MHQKETNPPDNHLLVVKNLSTHFSTEEGVVKAVDDVSFYIDHGETLGIVGESGSGKSVTALSILRIVSEPGKIVSGRIIFEDREFTSLSESEMRKIRGCDISMIFQDPMTSLNPVLTIGEQLSETYGIHERISKHDAYANALSMLKKVGIPLPQERLKQYPFELSGGMRQRVMIAMSLSLKPKLLIADEPTTALDVTVQAQILELIRELKREFGSAVILITHDLGVVAENCERVIVMYGGRIMEEGKILDIFGNPLHPYTKGLLACLPRADEKREKLDPIPGSPPRLAQLNPGCPFEERCPVKLDRCFNERPVLISREEGRKVACWLFENP
jgi:oligopeptide/dipeptide ABC transporter ATP-binding protein